MLKISSHQLEREWLTLDQLRFILDLKINQKGEHLEIIKFNDTASSSLRCD